MRLVVLGSGSAGNATCIEGGGVRLLLDAGFSCREIAGRLRAAGIEPRRIDAILVTHEHSDHVRGAALFSRTFGTPIHCTAATAAAAGLPGPGSRMGAAIAPGEALALGGLTVTPFAVPHDAAETVGFTVEDGGARLGYATDLGHPPAAVRERLRDCDLLMLESNHDLSMLEAGPYPRVIKDRVRGRHGHLDNEAAADVLSDVARERTARVILAHLSRTNNRPDLALLAARRGFERAGRRAPALHPADQWRPSPWFEV